MCGILFTLWTLCKTIYYRTFATEWCIFFDTIAEYSLCKAPGNNFSIFWVKIITMRDVLPLKWHNLTRGGDLKLGRAFRMKKNSWSLLPFERTFQPTANLITSYSDSLNFSRQKLCTKQWNKNAKYIGRYRAPAKLITVNFKNIKGRAGTILEYSTNT